MLKLSVATACVALVCPGLTQVKQSGQQQTVSEVVKGTVDAVVLIVVSDDAGKPFAEGSGFIASSDGKIVTNHHVIAGAHSAIVKLNNGAFFPVEGVHADDPIRDIAVLKVSGKNLPVLLLADSDALAAGDHVVAIGSPLGLENSVSDGVISGFREDSKGRNWVQTTAPASHGNSGGPLLTMDEKVAGVITWKNSEGENLNFAVPSKLIATVLTNSAVRPFGSVSDTESKTSSATPASATPSASNPIAPTSQERVWTSMTAGYDMKVRIDGDFIYVTATLPPELQSTVAYNRSEFKKTGDKWVGKRITYMPINSRSGVKWCRNEADAEIDKISETRIEGKAMGWNSTDPKSCQPQHPEMRAFVWIPK
jgi:Trypsin-like peptidase domain